MLRSVLEHVCFYLEQEIWVLLNYCKVLRHSLKLGMSYFEFFL